MTGGEESKEIANLALELVRGGHRVRTQNIMQRMVDTMNGGLGLVVLF
jgi:hypothetical protein